MQLRLLNVSRDLDEVEHIWTELESKCNTSYFLTWGWIENWLCSLPKTSQIDLAVVCDGDTSPSMVFLLGRRKVVRKHIFRSNGFFLNTSGNVLYDSACIEYNHILCDREGFYPLKELIDVLPEGWDEFFMPALESDVFPGNSLDQPIDPYRLIRDGEGDSHYVDLELVRRSNGDYLSLLSPNTRAQIRKSYRKLAPFGRISIEVCDDLESCMNMFADMSDFHNKSWIARGTSGAFESEYFYNLHRELIRKRFHYGEIQLLKVKSGEATIGYLYNFVFKGNVNFYQSGINYGIGKDLSPGIICHVEAIMFNSELGNSVYDFLGGSERYKASLSTHARKLLWARAQRPLLRFRVEDKARMIKHAISQPSPKRIT